MRKLTAGFSLMEMVLTIAIIGIFFSGIAYVFLSVGKGITVTRTRTVATNLAQEKIEALKSLSYSRLRVTSLTDYGSLGYDNSFYPPEKGILISNVPYERRVLIQRVKEGDDGKLIEVLPDEGDTAMKKITVTVVWNENGRNQSYSLSNMREDSNRRPMDGTIYGTIQDQATFTNLSGVNVSVVDNLNWNDITDNVGAYSIKVPTGTYQIRAQKDGYWPFTSSSFGVSASYPYSFKLKKMATASVTGYVFINDHVVISKVVASTITVLGEDLEWVELYNPTTFSWTINSNFFLGYVDKFSNWHYMNTLYPTSPPIWNQLHIVNATIPPYSYYLIANTATVVLGGYSVPADATYDTNVMDGDGKGGACIWVFHPSGHWLIDRLGWCPGSDTAPISEYHAISHSNGLDTGSAHVRCSAPGAVYPNQGNAFDSDNNVANFLSNVPISTTLDTYPKCSNASFSTPPISGYPAYGAVITCDDGLSSHTTSYMVDYDGYRLAYFQLPNIATGTCTASVFYQNPIYTYEYSAFQSLSNIRTFTDGQVLGIANAATTPPWRISGFHSIIATSCASVGYVAGTVRNGATALANPPTNIKIVAGTRWTYNVSNGNYMLPLDPGTYSITANEGNLNSNYVSETKDNVSVAIGQINNGVDFDISQGGVVSGRVRSNSNDNLPNVLVVAYNYSGNEVNSALTNSNGIYLVPNLPTTGNPYTIKPALDATESSNPAFISNTTVVQGSTIWVSTFSIASAYGTISGNVNFNGQPIDSGVLIIASTATISSVPPDFDYARRSGTTFYYGTVSGSDGSYNLEVRGGQNYNVYGWYGLPGSAPTQKSRSVSITCGVVASGNNLSWP